MPDQEERTAAPQLGDLLSADDVLLDEDNPNAGTDRGRYALKESLIRYGAGRSVLLDRDLRAIAGNKTVQQAQELGIPLRVIRTTGEELVAVVREDLDLEEDRAARELSFADNRVAELGLAWDAEQILAQQEGELDLNPFFHQRELDKLIADAEMELDEEDDEPETDPVPEMEIQPYEHYDYVVLFFRTSWDWARAIDLLELEERAFTFQSSGRAKGKTSKRHQKIGLCRVLDGAKFLDRLEAQCASSSPAENE
jgi:hypothetical protein